MRVPAPHAVRATKVLLERLSSQGHAVTTIPDAIERGLLTDLEWCEELNNQRSVFGVVEYVKHTDEKRKAAVRNTRAYRQRKKESVS